jgi:hypothetical protein
VSEVIQKKWAAIYANDEFVCVQTCSGLRSTASDPAGKLIFLHAAPAPHELGQALQAALSVSRTLTPEEIGQFFDVQAIEKRYEDWVAVVMQKFGYSTRRNLFKKMKHCQVVCSEGTISIRPTFHEKLEAWSGKSIEKTDHVLIPETVSSHDIGEGALLAMSKCISR